MAAGQPLSLARWLIALIVIACLARLVALPKAINRAKQGRWVSIAMLRAALPCSHSHCFVTCVAEHSPVPRIQKQPLHVDESLFASSKTARLKLNADWTVLSARHTREGDMTSSDALQHVSGALPSPNAYPAFSIPFAPTVDVAACWLAPFVHRSALISGRTAAECHVTPLKTTGKRKQNETLPRCGICARRCVCLGINQNPVDLLGKPGDPHY
jgi:hypothetical protein